MTVAWVTEHVIMTSLPGVPLILPDYSSCLLVHASVGKQVLFPVQLSGFLTLPLIFRHDFLLFLCVSWLFMCCLRHGYMVGGKGLRRCMFPGQLVFLNAHLHMCNWGGGSVSRVQMHIPDVYRAEHARRRSQTSLRKHVIFPFFR